MSKRDAATRRSGIDTDQIADAECAHRCVQMHTPQEASRDGAARERTVKSVEHAINILNLLAGPVGACGVTGVSAALGMNVSTVHHLLRTLRAHGLVEQDPESKLYRLGVGALQLGDAYLARVQPTLATSRSWFPERSVGAARSRGSAGATAVGKGLRHPCYKMVFIAYQPHTVATAWSRGIQDFAAVQANVEYQLLDGRGRVDRQISLMHAAIDGGVDAIFLQPVDSEAVGPSIRKAKDARIPVITLNIDSTEQHASHVEMNHYSGGVEIGKKMGQLMGGTGKVVILNAPVGIIIRDQRTNGFKDGLRHHPGISIVADESAGWDRKKASEVLSAILADNNNNIQGVFGVNDSMALGAIDVLKARNMLGKVVVFGDDGEKDALRSIEAGELTGTQYTDVYQQGRFAASLAMAAATSGATLQDFQGHLLMPYHIVTRDNVDQIQPNQRW
jgi:ribose transport system substrate-binding protein